MSRCINDIDAVVLPTDGGVFREYGYAAFTLLIARVHHTFGHGRPWSQRAGLLQELIDQRGLAMIDMGDDGDIAESLDPGH